ncbi:MAG: hypothetical protein AAGA77_24395 [Bacteroidota bacterium]
MKDLILTAFILLQSISLIQAQEKQNDIEIKENIHVKVKEGADPDIYVDGKKFDFPMELLDKDQIESINVIKGEKAIEEYNAKNGVVLITTKKKLVEKIETKIKITDDDVKGKGPMVIIDGNNSNQTLLKKLSPDDIESINVVKGEQALKKYNAPNGVIIITTKKNKRK